MSIDIKCAVTTAILSVLVYLLLESLLSRSLASTTIEFGLSKNSINETEWYKSMEIVLLVSVFIAFNLNNYLFMPCRSA